ncbi:AGE family epimerase/isomerase [Sphingobacterium paucimobilis]|uniref:N-acylglucosamine 2-epimerase n=1 Tax=Sphingobacterium paucimobilis HER1398 TaxID=1346330 RepID=U2J889_9SPHI|nr:AGE family epimerase/isomerase [Sphingobacterium paucimobilis]ERJ61124.1 hypothetical protein M472_20445 [Sphingobacterium paucimobilis HER1398]
MNFDKRAKLYSAYLSDNVIPFWLNHSIDEEYGGFYTCLDREGRCYDTDKFMWLQHRQVWTFAMLYNNYKADETYLRVAKKGADFLLKNGRDKDGNWFFALDRAGNPIVQPHSIFSDCFATMGYAQLFKASGEEVYRDIALQTFHNILERQKDPKGKYSKLIGDHRALKGFSLPMILCNLVLEIESLLPDELVESTLRFGVNEVMNVFYKEDLGIILENVDQEGRLSDTFEGRLVNPGHGLEAMWFVMDIAEKWGDRDLINRCVQIGLRTIKYGWDEKFGGIFYFLDRKGVPVQQLEWDQKLWWVHLEAAIAMLKGYQLTGNEECLVWYEKLHDYIWTNFVDQEYGEMYGYLNRRGEVLLNLKGGKWKGCFHVPRALYQLARLAEKIHNKQTLLEKQD